MYLHSDPDFHSLSFIPWGPPDACTQTRSRRPVRTKENPAAVPMGSPKSGSATGPGMAVKVAASPGQPGAVGRGFMVSEPLWCSHPRLGTAHTHMRPCRQALATKRTWPLYQCVESGWGYTEGGPLPRSGPDANSFRQPSVALRAQGHSGNGRSRTAVPSQSGDTAEATRFEK